MRKCPICNNKLYENYDLILPASAENPPEYQEYSICLSCFWTDKPIEVEEIPF